MGSALRCFVVVEQVLTRAAASKKKKADDDREEEQQQPGSDEQRRRRRKSSSARRAPARTPTTRASWGERDKKPLFVPDLSGSRKGRVKFFTRERLLSRGFRREPELFFLFFFFSLPLSSPPSFRARFLFSSPQANAMASLNVLGRGAAVAMRPAPSARPAQLAQQRTSSVRVAASNDAVSFFFLLLFRFALGRRRRCQNFSWLRPRGLPPFSLSFRCIQIGNGLDAISTWRDRQGEHWKRCQRTASGCL